MKRGKERIETAETHHHIHMNSNLILRAEEREVEKNRRRWLVVYRGVEFFVNLDELLKPAVEGCYVEIKSRTWSRRDARDKAAVITELLKLFGASPDHTLKEDYVELTGERDEG